MLKPEPPLAGWLAELDDWLTRSPGFFTGKPLILDVAGLAFTRDDIAGVIAELRTRSIRILGIEGADPATLDDTLPPLLTGGRTSGSVEAIEAVEAVARRAQATKEAATREAAAKEAAAKEAAEAAKAAGEPVATNSADPAATSSTEPGHKPANATPNGPTPEQAASASRVPSLLVETPVRSGQTIMNAEGDVIILGSVASGAEVIAAGSIHVYGALRGRALAGVYGNASARIFCRRFEAELVAISDFHKVTEEIEAGLRQKPVQAWLSDNELKVASLDQTDKEAIKWQKS